MLDVLWSAKQSAGERFRACQKLSGQDLMGSSIEFRWSWRFLWDQAECEHELYAIVTASALENSVKVQSLAAIEPTCCWLTHPQASGVMISLRKSESNKLVSA